MSELLEKVFQGMEMKDKRILEAGCGAGNTTLFLLERNAAMVLAVSNHPDDLEHCRKIIPGKYRGNVELVNNDLRDLKQVEGSSVDIVTAHFLFNVVNPFDADTILCGFNQALKPGGLLVVIDYAPFDSFVDDTSFIQRDLWNIENAISVLLAGKKMYHEYPMDWLSEHIEIAGFKINEVSIPLQRVEWSQVLLMGHIKETRRRLKLLKDENHQLALSKKLRVLTQQVENNVVCSGQVYSIIAEKK
ncbi:MAG: class I SAM-dependent methyltransferase [Candidatus Eremiobacteraeota bacterium]|nr:class I SAM-dependent methyltransferase [Candidatus Eremiobacteraeota bacterium]